MTPDRIDRPPVDAAEIPSLQRERESEPELGSAVVAGCGPLGPKKGYRSRREGRCP